ncbi:hypothetical protein EXIGLDRAFT_753190 [Exidia glandulosa HHB12029]|uniref:Uncharacterized protein n=1 Tax=Exidia glandulosa HHB12029 TaxID=1314781 RepID=A0A165DYL3_EXIGL|nr:hypothetical protein EXIGLDRAFT_753190 [Exidia glandulosa HHB12029]
MTLTVAYTVRNDSTVSTFAYARCLQRHVDFPQFALVRDGQMNRNTNRIFHGLLCSAEFSFHTSRKVVVKTFHSTTQLQHEVAVYARLAHLQGTHIPQLLAVYSEPGDEERGAIVLDDVGNQVGLVDELSYGSLSFRRDALYALMQIHDAGYELRDSANRIPIYNFKGRACFAGFAPAVQVSCARRRNIEPGSLEPSSEHFGCWEIYAMCVSAHVWAPDIFSFYERKAYTSMLSGDMWSLADCAPRPVDPREAIELAYEVAEFYAVQCNLPDLARLACNLRQNGNTERYVEHSVAVARGYKPYLGEFRIFEHLAPHEMRSDYAWPRIDRPNGALPYKLHHIPQLPQPS